ncbi:IucA/IucC family protein [Legionella hackeliae]|uniref:Siderophore biosynthetic enzyme FrgA n=1 Tax=Legionella hackeliae TaxID=449 RepID=A0A0A8UXY3_LEGHA|nr:IucA/IucC family protein [Legionella hackeliae]KTD12581.1 siderophore biosynthetic enzyme FrgA [Legionella hackeliae]CEK11997.1 siderophore biosynthetic enzyme FrgA [Legionella hackeliae]STX48779.1 siderophore biosynthetic enzyme FrgA [Legionella hackeliae]
MALAYGDFHELTHQLRFLLFEIGIGLPQRTIEYFISNAHRECLRRLQQAASLESLIQAPITSHHIHDYLEQLQEQLKHKQPSSRFFNWRAVQHELDETVANEAMAQAYRQCWQQEIRKQASGFTNFWAWLCQKEDTQEILQFLEQWGCLGHPYHPNFRAKIGFSRREILQYSPEFNAQLSLHWCALHQQHTYLPEHSKNYKALIAQQLPREYQLWQSQLTFKHYDPDCYLPLPLHPWQWRNQIQHQFSQLIDNKELILLPHHQLVKPSMSFRTMMPLNAGCHLKLAAAVHTTSALRTVSPASIENGPLLSSWIHGLLEKHHHYQHTLFIAADLAGMRVSGNTIPEHQHKQLAVIVRENPISQLKEEQILVPVGALFAQTPLSDNSLLIDIINASGLEPLDYLKQYCQCLLSGQLHLLLRYGIALEAHQQNTLIAFTNHRPTAVVIRDLGNITICLHRFYESISKPTLHPESRITTEELAALNSKFIHGNLTSNLAYWIEHLAHYHGFSTHDLWQLVRQELYKLLEKLSPDINKELFNYHKNLLFSKQWQHKALLTMRLYKENPDFIATLIANPLNSHE